MFYSAKIMIIRVNVQILSESTFRYDVRTPDFFSKKNPDAVTEVSSLA